MGVRLVVSTSALTRCFESAASGEVGSDAQAERPAAKSTITATVRRWRNEVIVMSGVGGTTSLPTPALITAHGAGTTLTGWETVGSTLLGINKLNQVRVAERVVAALVRDRRDLARLEEALRPSQSAPPAGVLHAFQRVDRLELALQCAHYDVLVIEPTDIDGQNTEETIRGIRARYPRLSVLGHVLMKPGISSSVLAFARAGVHELIVAGIDDSAIVLRLALQRASQRCLAEEVFAEIGTTLPGDAARLVRYCIEHASEAPTIEDISKALGVHRRTLVNRMQNAMLPPPSELWAWSRVLLAARYLEMPGRSVEWVALTVGYPSANALRNALKKYTGLIPSELREDGGFTRAARAFRTAMLPTSRRSAGLVLRTQSMLHRSPRLGATDTQASVRQAV